MTILQVPHSGAPIGVFDSGLGGLSVVRWILSELPNETVIYVADQEHVPYGGRDLSEVRGFAGGISSALVAAGCKAIVMACNISSATALDEVSSRFPHIPVLGVIRPGAREAVSRTRNKKVGVLATSGTVKSGAYSATVRAIDREIDVYETACPEFVPLVESGSLDTDEAREACATRLEPLLAFGVDTVILGCTHYPFLLPALRHAAPDVIFVDPAGRTAAALSEALHARCLAAEHATGEHIFTTTGDVREFKAQMARFLPEAPPLARVAHARWRSGTLSIPVPCPVYAPV